MGFARTWMRYVAGFVDFRQVFAIDLRSLALVRIFTALILLCDLLTRLPDLHMFYGDGSTMPVALQKTFAAGQWSWSIHTYFSGTEWIAFVFAVEILFAIALLLGFWTRTSSVISWVLVVSLHNTNPLILLGGDFLLRQTMLAGMFVPWGEVFSLDRYFSRTPLTRATVTSVWTAVFLIQLSYMYYFASMYKNSIEWNVDGSAFYYILSIDQYVTPLGRMLLQIPEVLKFLTIGVNVFQHFVVFLLFIPFFNSYIRAATAGTLMLMHLCFGIGTHLGIFSWISMTALIAFMPSMVWQWAIDFLSRWKNKCTATLVRYIVLVPTDAPHPSENRYTRFGMWAISALGICYISMLFLWQAAEFAPWIHTRTAWDTWTIPVKIFRLDQHWNLFAPRPYTDDGWDIVEGHLADGRVVDLFRDGAPISYEKPADVYAVYYFSHRRQFTLDLRAPNAQEYRVAYAQYLCSSWNASHTGGDHLVSLKHIFMLEQTPPPGAPQSPVVPMPLISFSCPL